MSEFTLDPKEMRGEERERLRKMMQSREFRFLLDHVFVKFLEYDVMQLRNPTTPYRRLLFIQGGHYRTQQLLDYCCSIAELPGLFSPRQATGLDPERLHRPDVSSPGDQPVAETPGASSYGSGRTSFPA